MSSDTSALEEALSLHPLMGLMDTDVPRASVVLQGPTRSCPVNLVPLAHCLGLTPAYPALRAPTVLRQPLWNPSSAQKVTLGLTLPSFSPVRQLDAQGPNSAILIMPSASIPSGPVKPQLLCPGPPIQWGWLYCRERMWGESHVGNLDKYNVYCRSEGRPKLPHLIERCYGAG